MSNKNCCKNCCKKCFKKCKNLNVSKKIDEKDVSTSYKLIKHWSAKTIYDGLIDGSGDFSLTTYSRDGNANVDLTNGITTYINNADINVKEMIELTDNNSFLKLSTKQYKINETTIIYKSIRMVSTPKTLYKKGLFVIAVSHIPTGPGIWPSWWLAPNDWRIWPKGGEIDIIEGVNAGDNNIPNTKFISNDNTSARHTVLGCPKGTNANEGCNAGSGYLGCSQSFKDANGRSFGVGFNKDQKGGVYVCELTDQGRVRIWFFQNGYNDVPKIFTETGNESPITDDDIKNWSIDKGKFVEFVACSDYFYNLVMTLNTAVCGDWANAGFVPSNNEGCEKFINTPSGTDKRILPEAYWSIQYIRYYNKE
jgi:hypothetical protein